MIVTPGHTLAANEEVTRQKLNLLGNPTVQIENGDVTTSKLADKAVTPAKLADDTRALLNGFKNKIINGNFEFERRNNAASPATGDFPFDRWAVEFDGSAGTSLSVAPIASNIVGSPAMEDRTVQVLRWNQANAGSGDTFRRLRQRIENARTLANQTVTISFWMAMSLNDVVTVSLVRNYGTGGSPSSAESIAVPSGAITGIAGWVRQELTVTLLNVQGKSFGTNGNSYLELRFALPINDTFDFYLGLVQLELGPVASDFEQRGTQIERFLCDRYYETSYPPSVYANAASEGGTAVFTAVNVNDGLGGTRFRVPKRVSPTVTIYSPNGSAGAGSVRDTVSPNNVTGVVASRINASGFVSITKNSGLTSGNLYDAHYTASAEL
jgi:hypothetical protein